MGSAEMSVKTPSRGSLSKIQRQASVTENKDNTVGISIHHSDIIG